MYRSKLVLAKLAAKPLCSVVDKKNHLCSKCDSIDFKKLLKRSESHRVTLFVESGFNSISLGLYGAVEAKASDCAFCRLVIRSIPASNFKPNPEANIELDIRKNWRCCVSQSDTDGTDKNTYNNEIDVKAKHQKAPCDYGFRLLVTVDGYPFEGQIQILADAIPNLRTKTFLGRAVDPISIEPGLMQAWYQRCQHYHHRSCSEPGSREVNAPRNFRVIDLWEKRIVPGPTACQFAALSYTWGDMGWPMPKTCQSSAITSSPAVTHFALPPRIPRTISDAMYIAGLLGFRYFWVDALCIIQDDESDIIHQIDHMDAIYCLADLTIVAGAGLHADTGLHGVSIPREYGQFSEVVKDFTLTTVLPNYSIMNSPGMLHWNTRGWTLQEKLLSRRILLFTNHQVFFKCKNAIWNEDVIMETDEIPETVIRQHSPFSWVANRHARPKRKYEEQNLKIRLQYHLQPILMLDDRAYFDRLRNYISVVENYSRRDLGDPNDVERALKGILNSLNMGDFVASIPFDRFALVVLWQPRVGSSCVSRGVQVPSWSWTHWRMAHGCEWDFSSVDEGPESDVCYELSKFCNYITIVDPTAPSAEGLDLSLHQRSMVERTDGLCNDCGYTHHPDALWTANTKRAVLTTQVVHFGIKPSAKEVRSSQHPLAHDSFVWHEIVDPDGHCVGHILISSDMVSKRPPNEPCAFLTMAMNTSAEFEDIEISSPYIHRNQKQKGLLSLRTNIPAYPPQKAFEEDPSPQMNGKQAFPLDPSGPSHGFYSRSAGTWPSESQKKETRWKSAHVMLVDWLDCGVAKRVALGRVIISAWWTTERHERQVTLV